jgi:hypothetical protein
MVPIQPTIADDPVAVMGWRLGNRDARFGRVPWLPAIPNACMNTRFGIAICSPPVYIGGSWKGFIRNRTWHARRGPQLGHTWWRSAAYGSHSSEPHRRLSNAPTGRGTLPSLVMRVRFRHQHHSEMSSPSGDRSAKARGELGNPVIMGNLLSPSRPICASIAAAICRSCCLTWCSDCERQVSVLPLRS